jgi:HD superfamily phosphodiesterase
LTRFQELKTLILGKLENELPLHLAYHNIDHTIDVIQAAALIADREHLDENDRRLLLTAALFHDTGFLNAREEHEAASCELARQCLPAFDYQAEEMETICRMIMATRIPQSPQSHLEEILCDADLDYLGRDDFFILSERLFTELQAEGLVKDDDEWNRQQADFMERHHYFTGTSVKMHQAKKEQYIKVIKKRIQHRIFNENQ